MATFAPKAGCPLCSIVTANSSGESQSSTTNKMPQIVHRDEQVTAYLEQNNPVSSKGHVIIVFNLHVPSIYSLSSSDLPLLTHIQNLGVRLLSAPPPSLPPPSPNPLTSPNPAQAFNTGLNAQDIHVGFITSPFHDPKIPVKDHLHAHAYQGTLDLAGWWRKVAYSGIAWYSIDDLIAEIREQTSNNRIKSAHPGRVAAPIDMVHDAGAKSGLANGTELPNQGLGFNISASDIPSTEASSFLQNVGDHPEEGQEASSHLGLSQRTSTSPKSNSKQSSQPRDSIPLAQVPSPD